MRPYTLCNGDNLAILHEHIDDASVDLIYLDPPFNSARSTSASYRSPQATDSFAIHSFEQG